MPCMAGPHCRRKFAIEFGQGRMDSGEDGNPWVFERILLGKLVSRSRMRMFVTSPKSAGWKSWFKLRRLVLQFGSSPRGPACPARCLPPVRSR